MTNPAGQPPVKPVSLKTQEYEVVHPQYCGLTTTQFEVFKGACQRAWSYVSSDIERTQSRAAVIETVLDADRVATFGHDRKWSADERKEWDRFYKEELGPLITREYNSTAFQKMMKEIFPQKRY